ncbi:MAG: hypothetical protein KGZ30_03175 [Anaplasmataceae bacterium]|nr:hypothetical protein [Anaplasmataceae bacterium]
MKRLLKIGLLVFIVLAILGTISKNKKNQEGGSLTSGSPDTSTEGNEPETLSNENTGQEDQAPSTQTEKPERDFERISIQGETQKSGYADVSLEYQGNTGWIAYSWTNFVSAQKQYVETHIAKSTDRGATWQYVTIANKSNDAQDDKGNFLGIWRNETPALVYDPTDSADKRWKLYYQRYLAPVNRPHAYTLNIIAYQHAASPEGPWSEAMCLIGNLPGCKQKIGDINSGLSKMVFFNELGIVSYGGRLYMSMDVSPSDTGVGNASDLKERRMILLSSSDHGNSWQYVGVLTNYDDAISFGYATFTASSLTTHNGKPYLMISPSGSLTAKEKGHQGSYIISFDDINQAKLSRVNGKLNFIKTIPPPLSRGGQSDYDDGNTEGGIIFSQLNTAGGSQPFQIFNTFQHIAN